MNAKRPEAYITYNRLKYFKIHINVIFELKGFLSLHHRQNLTTQFSACLFKDTVY